MRYFYKGFEMKKFLVLFLGFVLFFSGCDKKDKDNIVNNNTVEKSMIKIGVITPLTGDGATYGEATKRGIELALGDRKDIQLIYEDSKLNQKDSVTAIKKLIFKDKVDAIFGPFASSNVLAVAPIAEKNKILLMTASATADAIKDSGKYIFRNVPANNVQGITAANFIAKKLKKTKVYVYNMYNDYGISLKDSFISESSKVGLEIVGKDSFQPNTKDFKNSLLKIRSTNAEIVFFPGHYKECGLILKQARELGIDSIFVGTDGAYSPSLIDIAKESAEGSYYTLMAVDKTKESYQNFENLYTNKYNIVPDTYATYAYDAFNILLELDYTQNLIRSIQHKSFNTVASGEIKFDNNGEIEATYKIIKVNNQNFGE